MKFSVVSNLPEAKGILEAIRSSPEHQIVAERSGDASDDETALPMDGQSEVTHPDAEAVVIAVKSQSVAVALVRGAAEGGKSVLWFPPHDLDAAGIYELTQTAIDHDVAIVPVRASWWLPDGLAASEAEASVTSVQLTVNCSSADGDVPRAVELYALDVIRAVAGNSPQLTAIRIESPGGAVQQETITLGFGDGKSAVARAEFPSQIIINCSLPTGDSPDNALTLSFGDGSSQTTAVPSPVIGPAFVSENEQVLANSIVPALRSANRAAGALTEFSKSEELFAAIRESLRRRRTIDVYYDTASERSVFKTQMTAIGCGILTWLMFGLVAYLVIAQLLKPPVWVLHAARILWIAPVVLFLIFQCLLPIARGSLEESEKPSPD